MAALKPPHVKRIRTEAFLPYGPEQVWAVLSDFNGYAEWNPLNVWADGQAKVGAPVAMRFVDAGGGKGKIIAQAVTVTASDRPRYLEWVGRVPLIFTGRHFFEVAAEGSGIRLTHGEDLSGLYPMIFSAERVERQKAAYEEVNRALERRVASLQAAMVPRGGIEPPTP